MEIDQGCRKEEVPQIREVKTDSTFSSYLSGFNSFGRSFSRNVLAHDQDFHQEYMNALGSGSLPCNRLRILTIGDKGVGKSSTLQHLSGQVCDPSVEPQATEGIEITICETSERDPTWKLCRDGMCKAADDPQLCAAWCVCSGLDSMAGTLQKGQRDNEETRNNKQKCPPKRRHSLRQPGSTTKQNAPTNHSSQDNNFVEHFRYQAQLALPAVALFFLISFSNIMNNFGLFCWLAIFASLPAYQWDFNTTYRFITCVSVQIFFIDVDVSIKGYVSTLGNTQPLNESMWLLYAREALYVGICAMSLTFGTLVGLGCRSGIAMAFCLMTHTSLIRANVKTVLALIIGNLCGLLVLRDGFKWIQKLSIAQMSSCVSLVILIGSILLTVHQPLLDYWQLLCGTEILVGILMGFGFPYGVLKGREIVAVKKLRLPYWLKKSFGFVVALFFGRLIGWRMLMFDERSSWVSVAFSIVAVCGFLVYDWTVAQRVKNLEKKGIPITTFQEFLMESANQHNPVSLKLHFWDNGGDSIYQTMQQFFRPSEAVYLMVFNLEDARKNDQWQLQQLRQWLSTVKSHSRNPNTLVFVIGTHRDSAEVSEEFVTSFAAQINDQLYRDFCSILVMNEDRGGPLFVVENSKPVDQDSLILRRSIISAAKKAPFMKEPFPIWHLRVLNNIQKIQSNEIQPWIMTPADLLFEIKEDNLTLAELHKILVSLHRTGEVIYRDEDCILKEYAVIKPQGLLDVLTEVVCIPPKESRNLEVADDWMALEEDGIASLKLIKTVIGSDSMLPCVIRLMEAYNLLIPIYKNRSSEHRDTINPSLHPKDNENSTSSHEELPIKCILPNCLPDYRGGDGDFWEPSSKDEEYFFDFGYVIPDSIFHRLVAKCWHERDANIQVTVFKTRGRFRFKGANFYIIQLHEVSISQNTIRVIIQHNSQKQCSLQVLQFLYDLLEEIRRKDFPNLPYSCGPVCTNLNCSSDNFLKVLKIVGDNKEFPTGEKLFEAYMDQGRYHEVHLQPKLKVQCGREDTSPSTSSHTDSAACEEPRLVNQISVSDTARGVTIISGGYNSTFDIHPAKGLPDGEETPGS